jgi:hypothetical protein
MDFDKILDAVKGEIAKLDIVLGNKVEAKTFKYEDPITNEIFEYERKGLYRKNGRTLVPIN